MEVFNRDQKAFEMAEGRVKSIKKFYKNVAIFGIVFLIVYGRQIFKFEEISISRVSSVFIIWAGILAIKAVKLFFLNSEWESKMIEKELKKDNNGKY